MQVILLERIPNLGNMGEVVTVKPGFARNFLLSKQKALPATKDNLAKYEAQKAELEAKNASSRKEAENAAGKLEGVKVSVERQSSETGQLYGSVKPGDIQKALTDMGYTVPKGSVELAEPIKTLGDFTASVFLHPEVKVSVPVSVTRQVA